MAINADKLSRWALHRCSRIEKEFYIFQNVRCIFILFQLPMGEREFNYGFAKANIRIRPYFFVSAPSQNNPASVSIKICNITQQVGPIARGWMIFQKSKIFIAYSHTMTLKGGPALRLRLRPGPLQLKKVSKSKKNRKNFELI